MRKGVRQSRDRRDTRTANAEHIPQYPFTYRIASFLLPFRNPYPRLSFDKKHHRRNAKLEWSYHANGMTRQGISCICVADFATANAKLRADLRPRKCRVVNVGNLWEAGMSRVPSRVQKRSRFIGLMGNSSFAKGCRPKAQLSP